MFRLPIVNFSLLATLLLASFAFVDSSCAQWSWHTHNNGTDLWLKSTKNGQEMFDYRLGAGGAISEMRDAPDSYQALLASSYAGEVTDRIVQSTFWSQNIQNDIKNSGYQYYDRFNITQGGTFSGLISPTMQVFLHDDSRTIDVYSVPQDQWMTEQQSSIGGNFSTLTRYELKDQGVIRIHNIHRVGQATLNGTPQNFDHLYAESWTPFRQNGIFDSMTRKVDAAGNPIDGYSYREGNGFPTYPNWRVEDTEGYSIVYRDRRHDERTAVGLVYGDQQVQYEGFDGENPNKDRFVLNSMDWDMGSDEAIVMLPGIHFDRLGLDNPVLPGSIIEQVLEIVPRHGLDGELASLVNQLVDDLPAPTLYSPDFQFTGEMLDIVTRLNSNLSLAGTRTEHLGSMVQAAPAITVSAIPEPSSALLLAFGGILLSQRRRR